MKPKARVKVVAHAFARKVFQARGNHSEAHLQEGELAQLAEVLLTLRDEQWEALGLVEVERVCVGCGRTGSTCRPNEAPCFGEHNFDEPGARGGAL